MLVLWLAVLCLLHMRVDWCRRVWTLSSLLTFSHADQKKVLKVIASHDDGWYLVQNAHGAFGVVPGNYLFVTPKVGPPFRSFQRHAEEYHWNAQGCSAQK